MLLVAERGGGTVPHIWYLLRKAPFLRTRFKKVTGLAKAAMPDPRNCPSGALCARQCIFHESERAARRAGGRPCGARDLQRASVHGRWSDKLRKQCSRCVSPSRRLYRPDSQGRQARRAAGPAGHESGADHQSQDRKDACRAISILSYRLSYLLALRRVWAGLSERVICHYQNKASNEPALFGFEAADWLFSPAASR